MLNKIHLALLSTAFFAAHHQQAQAIPCSENMVAEYYDDFLCLNKTDDFDNLDQWDDGVCEKNEEYQGYNTWSCHVLGVKEHIYSDDKCTEKVGFGFYAWGSCMSSMDQQYYVKYVQKK